MRKRNSFESCIQNVMGPPPFPEMGQTRRAIIPRFASPVAPTLTSDRNTYDLHSHTAVPGWVGTS